MKILFKQSPVSGNPLSSKTVRNIYLNLSAAMEQAYKLDLIKKNPCKNVIHICENKVEGLDGKVITKKPKSESGIRDIPISTSLKEFLQKHYKEFLVKKLKYQLNDKEDYVLSQADGKPYKLFSISYKFQKFLVKNNLRHIRVHDLRHTNASIMLQQGISPKVAQQRLGHSDFSVTMNVYSHVMKSVETEATDKLDEVLFRAM